MIPDMRCPVSKFDVNYCKFFVKKPDALSAPGEMDGLGLGETPTNEKLSYVDYCLL
jgi:hypothetical protein